MFFLLRRNNEDSRAIRLNTRLLLFDSCFEPVSGNSFEVLDLLLSLTTESFPLASLESLSCFWSFLGLGPLESLCILSSFSECLAASGCLPLGVSSFLSCFLVFTSCFLDLSLTGAEGFLAVSCFLSASGCLSLEVSSFLLVFTSCFLVVSLT